MNNDNINMANANNNNTNVDNTTHEENVSSIQEFDFSLICEYFSSISRQGPGSDESTQRALSMIHDLGDDSVIADLGCGCGSQTIQLALHTQAKVKALDLFPLFIDKLMERCRKAGVSHCPRHNGQIQETASSFLQNHLKNLDSKISYSDYHDRFHP